MIIRAIDTKMIKVPLGTGRGGSGVSEVELIFSEILTDDGIAGNGFTFTLTGGGASVKTYIDTVLEPFLIGKRIADWNKNWYTLWDKHQRMGNGNGLLGLSCMDIAIWDLRAKAADLPLYQLLGQQREEIPIYGSGRATHSMNVEQLIEGSLSYVKEGYKAVKLRAGALGIHEDIKRIRAVREAVGPEIEIMVDCNERLTYPEALYLGKKLEELDIFWMEEPLISGDIHGHKRLSQALTVPIAVGEHLHGRFDFVHYIQQSAATIFQPDVPLVGGISEWIRIANITEGFGCVLTPHFLPELHIQVALATKNCISIEHFPLIDDILGETLIIKNGMAIPPQRPGHGMIWDEEKMAYYEVK